MILAAVLNRLTGHSPEVRAELATLAGCTVHLRLPLRSATLQLDAQGDWQSSTAAPQVSLRLPLSFFLLRTHDPLAAARQIELGGDATRAAQLAGLLSRLRWDAAEDLSALVGDVLAQRLVQWAGWIGGVPGALGGRLARHYADYLRHEAALLAPPADVARWQEEVTALQQAVAALERRLARLE